MSNKSVKSQSESAIISEILNGKIYREGDGHAYNFSSDVTDACIDSSMFADPSGLRLSLGKEIINLLDSKDNIQDKFKIAEFDKENVIAAYLATYKYYSVEDISNLLASKDEYLGSIGVGLAIINDNPKIIPNSNIEGLYKYFRSREIKADELNHFASDDFIKNSFHRMLKEERVIFTWMINNLAYLVDIDAVNIDENSKFFVSLLRDNDYQNETHKALFILCLKKSPGFIEEILKIKLNIDPFTKQYNFAKWLKEIRKFSFISGLRDSLPKKYNSKEISLFDKRKADFYQINKNDRSLAV